jgi:hypothetical protein
MIHAVGRLCRVELLLLALLAIYGCSSSAELVSVEDKIARLRLGQTGKIEVESIFGVEHGNDRNRWAYNFSDRQFEIFERRQGAGLGALPITAGVIPINTRALVVVTFNETGVVKRIEVARFFDEPFVNDYWYILKEAAKDPMESLASLGESIGFKAAGLDRGAGTLTLEDPNSKARIAIKLDGRILRVTSRNPHHRLGNEYRVYSKRESAFTNSIAESDLIQ